MTLEHELNDRRARVPELHTAILGTGYDPLSIMRYRHTKDIVLDHTQRHRLNMKNRRNRTLCPRKFIVHAADALSPSFLTTELLLGRSTGRRPVRGSRFGAFANNLPTSQYLSVLSRLPLTIPSPSGVNATLYTLSLCPLRRSISWPVATSHMRTVLSREPAATRRPSGEIATLVTPESAVSVSRSARSLLLPSCISQMRVVRSPEPDIIKRPSREK